MSTDYRALPVRPVVLAIALMLAFVLTTSCSSGQSDEGKSAPATAANSGPAPACKDLPPARAIEPIVAPGRDVPANLAAFSGAWEGNDGATYAGLVVQNVDAKEATSFYVYGPLRGRFVSQFLPDGSLHQGGSQQITFTWTLDKDRAGMTAVRLEGNNRSTYAMKKCTLQP